MGPHARGLGLVLVLVASGCGTHGLCDPSTCAGCCDVGGKCQLGSAPTMCGSHGNACQDCVGGSCFAGACLGGGTGGGHAGAGGGHAGGGTGGGSTAGYPTCTVAEDCPYWYCDCQSGPPVNSRRCINNVCLDGRQSCGDACAGFDSCWLGTSSGGFAQGSNFGPSTCGGSGGTSCSQTDLGRGCTQNSDCQSGLCFGTSPFFLCTKGCVSANDCPRNWACVPSSQGGSICMTGTSSTPKSTNGACQAMPIDDIGAPCSTCESKVCTSSMCTRRCDVSTDCPSSWSCGSGGNFNICLP